MYGTAGWYGTGYGTAIKGKAPPEVWEITERAAMSLNLAQSRARREPHTMMTPGSQERVNALHNNQNGDSGTVELIAEKFQNVR